ncbi:MAG: HAD-IA family hydrolase [Acidobacteria bacterium]|nr:HAD-IA family hydrolase [Acidobacteriota bacterium]
MTHRPFELLIFDWDGTLIDSIGTIVACTQAAVADLDLPPIADEAIRNTIGMGLKETVEALLPGADPELYQRLREVYFKHWVSTYAERPLLFDGAEETLVRLHQAGYLLAVATGKSRRGLERDMDRVGTRELFAATRTVDEAPSKPHPEMVLALLDELGVQAGGALVIGDTSYDMEMATSAGTRSLGVSTGSHSCEELASYRPLGCLPSVLHLPDWLVSQGRGR